MKYFIKTFGCKVNQSESDELDIRLQEVGLKKADAIADADVVVINSCTVTGMADAKLRQFVSKTLKQKNDVIVTGCAVDNIKVGLDRFGSVRIVNNSSKDSIASLFKNKAKKTGSIAINRSRPLIKIQDGCSHNCSYCIVPSVRGDSKSLPVGTIKEKAKSYIDRGFAELVLTGVDIADYNYNGTKLKDLIKEILSVEDSFRIRLSSLEPQSVDEDFVDYFSKEDRICNHVHLPLQSGSDKILKLMNRPYEANEYIKIVDGFKRSRANVAITTDIIVGFPEESEEDFLKSVEVLKRVSFSKVHIFRYSKREGTLAAEMERQVAEHVKKQRAKQLNRYASENVDEFKKNLVGKNLDVLVEKYDGKYQTGLSSNYCRVYFEQKAEKGKLVNVKIDNYEDNRLFGKIVN